MWTVCQAKHDPANVTMLRTHLPKKTLQSGSSYLSLIQDLNEKLMQIRMKKNVEILYKHVETKH